MNFIEMAGATMKQGFNTIAGTFQQVGSGVAQAGRNVGGYFSSGFFPAEQREKLVSSNVSIQTYQTGFGLANRGFRPVVKESPTLWNQFQGWWEQKVQVPVAKYYAGKEIAEMKKQTLNTIVDATNIGIARVGASLTDYFINKWGLSERQPEPNDRYAYLNEYQSNAPATVDGADGFFSGQPSQPVGSFWIGNPQSAGIPSSIVTGTGDYPMQAGSGGGFNIMPILLIAGVAVFGIWIVRRK